MDKGIQKIVDKIVTLTAEINSDDEIRDLYSVLRYVDIEIGKIMCMIKEQHRNERNEN